MDPGSTSLLPAVPIDVALHPAADGKPGSWKVQHEDGTLLFESTDENAARDRLDLLRQMAQTRIAAGHKVTGADLTTLFPPTAPAPLLLTTLSSEDLKREDVFDPESKTWTMANVEIFRTGKALKLSGKEGRILEFVPDDVTAFVEAFDALGWTPPLKIGHETEQPIVLEQLPTIGRVVALRTAKVKGLNGLDELGLFADWTKVPDALHAAIRDGRLFQRSIEFWTDHVPRPDGGGKFHRVLKAVSLLGDLPAVRGMPPLDVAPAKFSAAGPSETATVSTETDSPMDTPPKPGAGTVITLSVEDYEKQKQALESAKTEAERLSAENKALSTRVSRLEVDRRTESATASASRLRDSGKITPAQEQNVVEILKSLDDEKTDAVTVTTLGADGKSQETKKSQRGALLSLLDSMPKHPNAPGSPASRGNRKDPAGVLPGDGFATLSFEDQKKAVAALGEKYAEETKAKTNADRLACYERAEKDLSAGKVEAATVLA